MSQKLAACIITGDAYDEDEVKAMLKSLEDGGVDAVFVNYNGTKRKLPWAKWTNLPLTYKKFKWEENFALARQQSFDLFPKDEFDWMIWVDTDDLLKMTPKGDPADGEFFTMQDMFDSLDPYTQGVFIRYAYAVEPETNIVVVEQWRERILSTKIPWQWKYPIHEVAAAPQGTQFARREHVFIEHQRKNGEDRGARDRNRKIIAKAMREDPNESRYMFYFAGETLAEADTAPPGQEKIQLIDAAIVAYERYKQMSTEVADDYYLATNRIAELLRMRGEYLKAIDADLECIAIYPTWPDGYVGAAKSCMELGDFARCKAFAHMATLCPKPMTAASIEPMMSGFTPLFLRAIAEAELGEYKDALRDFKDAREIWNPPNDMIDDKIAELETLVGTDKSPAENERKRLRGTKPDRSIAFYTSPLPFVWHPQADAGAGAERCILQLAPRFAADGWRVAVFGTPGEHRGVFEGVEYWDSDEFLPNEEFSVFVSSRSALPFEAQLASKRSLLWMHDVNIAEHMYPIMNRPDMILGLTNWHVAHLAKLYGISSARLAVMPNGIETDRFEIDRSEDNDGAPKFIWSSSPDRGLDTLLSLWGMIRGRYPDAELHMFYGWNIISQIIEYHRKSGRPHTWLENFVASIVNQIEYLGGEEGGLFEHGRVGQQELSEHMYKANYWPYTTGFMETFCITAVEMQAAGVIPITSKLAALNEVVAMKEYLVDGWPLNRDYQLRWLSTLEQFMESDDMRLEARQRGREHAMSYTWDSAYAKWNDLFKTLNLDG